MKRARVVECTLQTEISTGAWVTCRALKPTQETVLAKVLLADVTAMPLTVACASAAACVTVLLSVARLDRSSAAVSAAAPSAPPEAAPRGSTPRRKPPPPPPRPPPGPPGGAPPYRPQRRRRRRRPRPAAARSGESPLPGRCSGCAAAGARPRGRTKRRRSLRRRRH